MLPRLYPANSTSADVEFSFSLAVFSFSFVVFSWSQASISLDFSVGLVDVRVEWRAGVVVSINVDLFPAMAAPVFAFKVSVKIQEALD